jgi:hypothetical protein
MKSKIQNPKSELRPLKQLLTILSSQVFLLWLVGGWIIYYVVSAIWREEAFAGFVSGIGNNIFVQALFIIFLLSGYLNLFRTAKDIFRRGKLNFLSWIILPLGLLLFFTAFFLSILTRETVRSVVGEGNLIKPPWVEKGYRVTRIEPGLKENILDRESDTGIFAYEPNMTVIDQSNKTHRIGAFPPSKIYGMYYHILNFGIAPGVRLLEGNTEREKGYMPLRILVLESSDFFEMPPLPYRFLIRMKPEKSILKNGVLASQYNLKEPVYNVRVFKGDTIVTESDSQEKIRFDNFTLEFFTPTFWILLVAVNDPALPILRLGLLLITIGIPLSFIRLILIRHEKK